MQVPAMSTLVGDPVNTFGEALCSLFGVKKMLFLTLGKSALQSCSSRSVNRSIDVTMMYNMKSV